VIKKSIKESTPFENLKVHLKKLPLRFSVHFAKESGVDRKPLASEDDRKMEFLFVMENTCAIFNSIATNTYEKCVNLSGSYSSFNGDRLISTSPASHVPTNLWFISGGPIACTERLR
jgi:hypothetical protein